MIRDAAIVGGQARDACQPHRSAIEIDRYAVFLEFASDHLRHAVGQSFSALQAKDTAITVIECYRDVGPRHREALHHIETCGILAARGAQKFPASWDLAEEILHPYPRPRRQGGRTFADQLAVIDDPLPALLSALGAAFQGKPRNTGDAGQRLTAKSKSFHQFDGFIGQLRRCMPFQRQRQFVGRHAATVVGHLHAGQPAFDQLHGNARCPGIDCILDQLLQRGRRPFDHLAGGNTVDQCIGKTAYFRHGADTIATKREDSETVRFPIPRSP